MLDSSGRLIGSIGLRELAAPASHVRDAMRPVATALPTTPVIDILNELTNGVSHAVVIISDVGHALGLVTQTDLLAAFTRDLRSETAQA